MRLSAAVPESQTDQGRHAGRFVRVDLDDRARKGCPRRSRHRLPPELGHLVLRPSFVLARDRGGRRDWLFEVARVHPRGARGTFGIDEARRRAAIQSRADLYRLLFRVGVVPLAADFVCAAASRHPCPSRILLAPRALAFSRSQGSVSARECPSTDYYTTSPSLIPPVGSFPRAARASPALLGN